MAHVPQEWRGIRSVLTPSGEQEMVVLSEQGLYFFLGRSDKPAALSFQKWLAGEVLPSIRTTGCFSMSGKDYPLPLPKDNFTFRADELPEDVRRIGPKARERYLGLAMQAARIAGENDMRRIFAFFVDVCRTLTAGSLSVVENAPGYAFESVCRFVEACCQSANPKAMQSLNSLYAAYESWCQMQEDPERSISKEAFRRVLPAAAPTVKLTRPRENGGRVWYVCGLQLGSAAAFL